MEGRRIRLRNVGRLAVAVAGGGALLVVGPSLFEAPEPPPLPDDVGLAAGATGVAGHIETAPAPPAAGVLGGEAHRIRKGRAGARHDRRAARHPRGAERDAPDRTSTARRSRAGARVAPTPAPPARPQSASAASAPVPPPARMAPPPRPPRPAPPSVPPEFGFEH